MRNRPINMLDANVETKLVTVEIGDLVLSLNRDEASTLSSVLESALMDMIEQEMEAIRKR
jgi:hypothetical protein